MAVVKPVPGKPCPKVNVNVVYKNYKYTCKKYASKYLWSNGVRIQVPSIPAVTPSPTPSPTPTPTPSPSLSPTPTPTPTPFVLDPYRSIPENNVVVAKIKERISTLRQPSQEANEEFLIFTEADAPLDAIASVKKQHLYMLRAFPDVFKWGTNNFYIFDTVAWAKEKAIELNCWMPPQLLRPEEIPQTMWSITTHCGPGNNDKNSISFLNWPSYAKYDSTPARDVTGTDMWAYQAAQEGDGSTIQTYYYLGKEKFGINNPLPAWFEQGGQFALSSVALAIQTRNWRQSSLIRGKVSTCNLRKVEDSSFYNANPNLGGCHYQLGGIATELMIALYGFDAPITWFKNIEISPLASQNLFLETWQTTFKKSYGDDISTFYRWANAYAEYLETNGESKLPDDLLLELKNR